MGKGALVFKGDKPDKKKKKKKKKSKHPIRSVKAGAPVSSPAASSSLAGSAHTAVSNPSTVVALSPTVQQQQPPEVEEGIGRITTSGTVLTGHATELQGQRLRPGDAILVTLPDGSEEMRVLTMVLSESSASLSTPFGASLSKPADFRFIKKPRDAAREGAERAKRARATKEEEERSAFGMYGNGPELVYREVTEHGSYRIRREKLRGEASRGDMLHMRTKRKSDKYC